MEENWKVVFGGSRWNMKPQTFMLLRYALAMGLTWNIPFAFWCWSYHWGYPPLTFLTQWSFQSLILEVAYLWVAAGVTTVAVRDGGDNKVVQKIALFTRKFHSLIATSAIMLPIAFSYAHFGYGTGLCSWAVLTTHGVNAVIMILDIVLHRQTLYYTGAVWPVLYLGGYVVFSVIVNVATGLTLYPQFDWVDDFPKAFAYGVALGLAGPLLVHTMLAFIEQDLPNPAVRGRDPYAPESWYRAFHWQSNLKKSQWNMSRLKWVALRFAFAMLVTVTIPLSLHQWVDCANFEILLYFTKWSFLNLCLAALYLWLAVALTALAPRNLDGSILETTTVYIAKFTCFLQAVVTVCAIVLAVAAFFPRYGFRHGLSILADIFVHYITAMIMVLDMVLSKQPFSHESILCPLLFIWAYLVFTYVYAHQGGKYEDGVSPYVYPILDWTSNDEGWDDALIASSLLGLVAPVLVMAVLVSTNNRVKARDHYCECCPFRVPPMLRRLLP
eukprot:gnl/MRDRNA2_/MRDRNA2_131811_c0_seq1.p1 gnl/MRDRNA2_/MRDRNA2_131811_c0~~gnl/MRDRNA2_/MRDRNA2_131811_c0_seq1.p1  ORF type:complete len:498 (+),score=48.33 gnl/MRDRNA2_/MRDRNA2_131811_c0_seq1:118-1611(+)